MPRVDLAPLKTPAFAPISAPEPRARNTRSEKKAAGAGYDAQSQSLSPGAQSGYDAQAAALVPGPVGMPTLPAVPARKGAAAPGAASVKAPDPAVVRGKVAAILSGVHKRVQEIQTSDDPKMAYARAIPLAELSALVLYTGPQYEQMNAVLRGTVTDPTHDAVYKMICTLAVAALEKATVPSHDELVGQVALNYAEGNAARAAEQEEQAWKGKSRTSRFLAKRHKSVRDARKARRGEKKAAARQAAIPRVYRTLGFRGADGGKFFKRYQAGGTVREDAFMSAGVKPVAISGEQSVRMRIWDPTGGHKIRDLSLSPSEEEVLFAPGQVLKIDSIKMFWKFYPKLQDKSLRTIGTIDGPSSEAVASPAARFPLEDGSPQAYNDPIQKEWAIEATLVTPPPANQDAADQDDAAR